MTEDVLTIATTNKIRLLTLNRPERRNALSSALWKALRRAVLDAGRDPDVMLVAITGAGDAFCAGADLREAMEMDQAGIPFRGPLHDPERTPYEIMFDCPKPIMAIINGPAMAGGFELALACDLRVAADTAFFGVTEAKRGMGAALASVLLPRMVPPAIAMEWLFTGRQVSLAEADRWGLLNRVVPRAQLMETAMELAADIVASAPLSLQRLKLTYRKTDGMPLHAGIRLDTGPDVYASEDRKEGARAFLERRAPRWQGK
jgi:enoyl-CoA hydratase